MLIPIRDLQLIAQGRIRVAFRRWTRPTVKSGGTLRTAIGVIAIDSVEPIERRSLTPADALAAGFASLDALDAALARRSEGCLYRIRLRLQGADPRTDLRNQSALTEDEVRQLRARLRLLDERSSYGAWTQRTLRTIRANPGCPAADLARQLGVEKMWLKTSVRKLKELGLTESLEVGYRVSPRGEALLAQAGGV